MTIEIISISNKLTPTIQELTTQYQKRLRGWVLTWRFISPGVGDVVTSQKKEAQAVLQVLGDKQFVVLLDETGAQLSSPQFSLKLASWQQSHQNIVFIIGGAHGVDASLRNRANFTWSLSGLVFPHQIVQILLIEQLYRAQSIQLGHPYHHA